MSRAKERTDCASDPSDHQTATKVRRFRIGERSLHWALALPYVLLYATAATMLITWGEAAPRPIHHAAAWMHRAAGIGLVVLPPLALLLSSRDWETHIENIRHGWLWDRNDVRWLVLFPKAAMDPRVTLPEQGKFNAAEKLNFMMVMATYPLYVVTGLLVWMPGIAFYSWLAHILAAALGLPLVVGHIYMATVNRSTRIGLEGMITGWVDREWAKHHYRRWYRERFERQQDEREPEMITGLLGAPARIRCDVCEGVHIFGSWMELLQRSFHAAPLFCPSCASEIGVLSAEAPPEVAEAILEHLQSGGAGSPFERSAPSAA